jgi:tRNA G46 methylase TrmB
VDAFFMFITICAFFPAVKKTAKTVSLHQIQNLKKYVKASTLCVGEINFGSFELLRTKNGLAVEVGFGMGTFFPGLVSSGPFYTVVFFPKSYEFSGIQPNSVEKFN